MSKPETFHATTIVSVRRHGRVVIGGDGQVTLGNTVMKSNARKVRRLGRGDVLAGFAGATADAETIRQWVNNQVGKTQRLAALKLMAELPRSAIGKILKRELRDAWQG